VDFVHLTASAWLIISDSGGVQEEAPSLGRPLLILRRNTERPEAISCGAARLVGASAECLAQALEESLQDRSWMLTAPGRVNPFGQGDSAVKIVNAIQSVLGKMAR
jgi:UDP-N-acetylglucosamine 2-epimerase (non-hydrolysing)